MGRSARNGTYGDAMRSRICHCRHDAVRFYRNAVNVVAIIMRIRMAYPQGCAALTLGCLALAALAGLIFRFINSATDEIVYFPLQNNIGQTYRCIAASDSSDMSNKIIERGRGRGGSRGRSCDRPDCRSSGSLNDSSWRRSTNCRRGTRG